MQQCHKQLLLNYALSFRKIMMKWCVILLVSSLMHLNRSVSFLPLAMTKHLCNHDCSSLKESITPVQLLLLFILCLLSLLSFPKGQPSSGGSSITDALSRAELVYIFSVTGLHALKELALCQMELEGPGGFTLQLSQVNLLRFKNLNRHSGRTLSLFLQKGPVFLVSPPRPFSLWHLVFTSGKVLWVWEGRQTTRTGLLHFSWPLLQQVLPLDSDCCNEGFSSRGSSLGFVVEDLGPGHS